MAGLVYAIPMRILHIIQRYWPAQGGAETHFAELSRRLAADGHDVTVLTTDALDFELFWEPGRRRIAAREDSWQGVRILRFPVRHLPLARWGYPAWRRGLWLLSHLPWPPPSTLAWLSRMTPYVPELWRWLSITPESFDRVAGMTICFEPLLEAGLRFARRRGIPFVAYPLTHLGVGPAPGKDAISSFYTMRHQVATVLASDAAVMQTPTEARFYQQRGLSAGQAVVAGPGIDPAATLGGHGDRARRMLGLRGPIVLVLGTLSYDKGSIHVVEAANRLWQQGYELELVLAGNPVAAFRRYLEQLPNPVRQRLHVLGPVDEQTKRDLLAAADLLAMPSRTDSFGIVYLEAWLYQKPVIGCRAWGIEDVIRHGEDGLLVSFGDVDALAAAIAYLLDHPQQAQAMGVRGSAKVYAYHTWAHKYAITRDLYARLVGE